jgi:hypothetical protein
MGEFTSFRFEERWKNALRKHCEDCRGDSMSLFIRRATINEMKRLGIEPIETSNESSDNLDNINHNLRGEADVILLDNNLVHMETGENINDNKKKNSRKIENVKKHD